MDPIKERYTELVNQDEVRKEAILVQGRDTRRRLNEWAMGNPAALEGIARVELVPEGDGAGANPPEHAEPQGEAQSQQQEEY